MTRLTVGLAYALSDRTPGHSSVNFVLDRPSAAAGVVASLPPQPASAPVPHGRCNGFKGLDPIPEVGAGEWCVWSYPIPTIHPVPDAVLDGNLMSSQEAFCSQSCRRLGYHLPPYDARLRKIGSPRLLA